MSSSCNMVDVSSNLEFIEIKDSNPIVLLKEWIGEYQKQASGNTIMNLATCDKHGIPTNRSLLLEDVVDDNIIFFTTGGSRKINSIKENPRVASCIYLPLKDVSKQIRVEGVTEKMTKEESKYYYDRKPLFCKIRSYLYETYNQSTEVDWNDLKKKHDEILKRVVEDRLELPIPNSQSAYKIKPISIEFYAARPNFIGDRVKFTKKQDGNWEYVHLVA